MTTQWGRHMTNNNSDKSDSVYDTQWERHMTNNNSFEVENMTKDLSEARKIYDYTKHFEYSKIQLLAKQPPEVVKEFYDSLSDEEKVNILYDPNFIARPKQIVGPYRPQQPHTLFCAGRAFGKTRVLSWQVNKWARENPNARIGIIGTTASEIRDVILMGESGIMQNSHPHFMPKYIRNNKELTWENGARASLISAETPEALRGMQFSKVAMDETFKWNHQKEVFEQIQFCLRLGDELEILITSTPRPTQLAKMLLDHPQWKVVSGCSYENSMLPQYFLESMVHQFANTTIGEQEIHARIIDDNAHALFKRNNIDNARVNKKDFDIQCLKKIVVSVDPAISENKKSDATGITVCGTDGEHGYVIEDLTLKGSPNQWAKKALMAAEKWGANYIVVESNQGGNMVTNTIKNIDSSATIRTVHATRSKELRMAPIAALYEQGKIHHVGTFTDLEDEMCNFDPSLGKHQKSPDRVDSLTHALTDLMIKPKKKVWFF